MRLVKYSCPKCGYSSIHELGTPDIDQALTDVNTEFSKFLLFICPKEQRFVGLNVLDPNFSGECPSDSAKLIPVENADTVHCPRCGQSLSMEELKPLAAADAGAE